MDDPVNLVDKNGLWTFQIGYGFNSGAGFGTTKSAGFAVSYDPETKRLQVGGYATGGCGLHVGITGDVVYDFTFSGNDSIEDLAGSACTIGVGVATPPMGPHAGIGCEVNIPINSDAEPSVTFSPGVGIGMPGEFHVLGTETTVSVWIDTGTN